MGARGVIVAFTFALAGGCATDPSGPTGTGPCATSAECFNGYACIDGHCRVIAEAGPGGPDVFVPGADTGFPTPPTPPFDGGPGFDAFGPDGSIAPPIDGAAPTSDGMPMLPDAFDPDAPIRCGAMDQPCCGMACNVGLSCLAGICRPRDECGGLGEICCATGCDMGLTCQDGTCLMCRTSMTTPGVTGTYFDRCGFSMCASTLTVTGAGTTITFVDGAGVPGGEGMGIFTLTGGVTASGSFTSACGPLGGVMCDLASVMGTPAGIVFTDRAGTTGTIALTGATASGTVMFPCASPDSCSRFFYATAEGTTLMFSSTLGVAGTITLSPALVCE